MTINKGDFIMKKKFTLSEIDCANCAAKMEDGIKKIDGVEEASINFMAQKLTVECDEDRYDEIVEQIKMVIKKIEPKCEITAK